MPDYKMKAKYKLIKTRKSEYKQKYLCIKLVYKINKTRKRKFQRKYPKICEYNMLKIEYFDQHEVVEL